MSFFLGFLMVAATVSVLRWLWTLVRWLGRGTGRWLKAVVPRRTNPSAGSWPRRFRASSAVVFGEAAPDWDALSTVIRNEILTRRVRAPVVEDPLAKLDLAIEIERRQLELARLKAEKAEVKARIQRPSRICRQTATRDSKASKAAAEHLALIRKGLGVRISQNSDDSGQSPLGSGSDPRLAPGHPGESSGRPRH